MEKLSEQIWKLKQLASKIYNKDNHVFKNFIFKSWLYRTITESEY